MVRRWQAGASQRGIAAGTGLSRVTVRRYIEATAGVGLERDGPAPGEEQLTRLSALGIAGPRKVETPTEDVLAPWAGQIHEWVTVDRLQLTRIHELLGGRGCEVSYTSLRRFVRKRGWSRRRPVTVRMDGGEPGEVAEMDFGQLGLMDDPDTGKRRVVWALIIMTMTDLAPLLRRLKLGAVLNTLPARVALARREQLDYPAFLQIILSDRSTEGTTGACSTPPSHSSSSTSSSTSCSSVRSESARASWHRNWATPP